MIKFLSIIIILVFSFIACEDSAQTQIVTPPEKIKEQRTEQRVESAPNGYLVEYIATSFGKRNTSYAKQQELLVEAVNKRIIFLREKGFDVTYSFIIYRMNIEGCFIYYKVK